MSENTVTITEEEYNTLLGHDQELCALFAAGVDNWEGYEEALSILQEWNSED